MMFVRLLYTEVEVNNKKGTPMFNDILDSYKRNKHYMRGPGPASRAKRLGVPHNTNIVLLFFRKFKRSLLSRLPSLRFRREALRR